VEEIATLPGIGPKIAHHVLEALRIDSSALAGVDTETGEVLDSSERLERS